MKKLFIAILLLCQSALATTYYLDSSASGAHNGTSWTDAWTSMSQMTGLSGDDIVYISGGTYTWSALTAGTSGHPITYKIGQTSGHNGTATFNSSGNFITVGNVIFSGDAGDGLRHFVFGSGARPIDTSGNNIRMSYVNCGSRTDEISCTSMVGIYIDNCYYNKTDGGNDTIMYLNGGSGTWGQSVVSNCFFSAIRSESGTGDDFIQGGWVGLTVCSNTFVGYGGTYSGTQHQDGLQPTSGSYIKVYGNRFQDIANYPIFCDAYYGSLNHIHIYNNIVQLRDSSIQSSAPPRGIVVVPDGAYSTAETWTDIIVANNTGVDYGSSAHPIVQVKNQNASNHITFANCLVANNISVNSDGGIDIDGAVTNTDNVSLTAAQATNAFTIYNLFGGTNNNLMPLVTATSLVGAGANLSSFFTDDIVGSVRPSSAAWTVGAYEYAMSTNAPVAGFSISSKTNTVDVSRTISSTALYATNWLYTISPDGFTTNVANFSYSFPTVGNYTITQVVSNSYGKETNVMSDVASTPVVTYVLQQEYATTTNDMNSIGYNGPTALAGSFVASSSYSIAKVSVLMVNNFGTPSGNISCQIWTDNGSHLPLTKIGESTLRPATDVASNPPAYYVFLFPTPVSVTNSSKYWVAMWGESLDSSHNIGTFWLVDAGGASGDAAGESGTTWTSLTTGNIEMAIKFYSSSNATVPVETIYIGNMNAQNMTVGQ